MRIKPYEMGYYDSFNHNPRRLHYDTATRSERGREDYEWGWTDGLGDKQDGKASCRWSDFVVRDAPQ